MIYSFFSPLPLDTTYVCTIASHTPGRLGTDGSRYGASHRIDLKTIFDRRYSIRWYYISQHGHLEAVRK